MNKKLIIGTIFVAVAIGGVVVYRSRSGATAQAKSVFAAVKRDTLIVSVTGSGHVSVSNQLDVKPKASGELVAVPVVAGQAVAAGTLLASIDIRDAQKAVRDAATNLESAQLALTKLKQPPDALTILQAENAIAQSNETKRNAQDALDRSFEDGFNEVANAFLDLPAVMTGLQDMLYSSSIAGGNRQWNIDFYTEAVRPYESRVLVYKNDVDEKYQAARASYNAAFETYKTTGSSSKSDVIDALVTNVAETARQIADAVKSTNNLIQFYKDKLTEQSLRPNPAADGHLTTLAGYTGKVNGHLTTLLSRTRSIQDNRAAIVTADRQIAEKTASLGKLRAGPDALDVQSQALTITQREQALSDARQHLVDYTVRAPFDGILSTVAVKRGDTVGTGTAIATLITKQRTAEVTLSEVDVARIRVGQKATITFDALPGLSVTGNVAEVATVGTVSQGVVTYVVKIAFDTQESQVRPGMSVSAAIITDAKPDVLVAPNAAVKSQGQQHYVELSDTADRAAAENATTAGIVLTQPTVRKTVEVGMSNDSLTEITNGLSEGDLVVTRTIQPTAQTSTASNTPALRIPGLGGGGGGGGGAGRAGGGGVRGD